jgi:hypothetical protein
VTLEIGIWRSLFFWVARRVPGHGPGAQSFAYAKQVTPLLVAFIVVSAVELPVVHLLLPWDTVRLIVLVLSVWGLLWMVGFLAGMKVFRHLLDDTGLRIRSGATVDIHIPWDAIKGVTSRRGGAPTGKSVDVERGDDGEVTEVRFYADDARALVAAAQERLPEAATSPRR